MIENISDKKFQRQAVDAIAKLENAINKAPIKEIRAALVEEHKFLGHAELDELDICVLELEDRIGELGYRAELADPIAIEHFIILHQAMTKVLTRIGWSDSIRSGDTDGPPKNSEKTPPEEADPTTDWRNDVNHAAQILYQTIPISAEAVEQVVRNKINILPGTMLSFPLDCLIGTAEPPDQYKRLVAELCDRLILQRLRPEYKRVIDRLIEEAQETLPALKVKHRKKGGPSNLAQTLYCELDQEKNRNINELYRARCIEQMEEMGSPAELLNKLENKRNLLKNDTNVKPERGISSYENAYDPHEAYGLYNFWRARALQLPPLSSEAKAINKWVEAALCILICRHWKEWDKPIWSPEIDRRIAKTGSILAGLKLFLREGFETLARKDCKK